MFWNTCWFTWLNTASTVRLLRVRHREKVLYVAGSAPPTTGEAAGKTEHQRAQIALAAQRLGLQISNELVDVGYSVGWRNQEPRHQRDPHLVEIGHQPPSRASLAGPRFSDHEQAACRRNDVAAGGARTRPARHARP